MTEPRFRFHAGRPRNRRIYHTVVIGSLAALTLLLSWGVVPRINPITKDLLIGEHQLTPDQWQRLIHRRDVILGLTWQFATSGSTMVLDATFNTASNNIYCIGAGAAGGNAANPNGGGGGGGGAFATRANYSAVGANGTVDIIVGTGNTTFDTVNTASKIIAVAGTAASGTSGAAGGAATSCTPTSGAFSGGAGANAHGTNSGTGGGGGGAAGQSGAGGAASGNVGGTGDNGNTAAGVAGTNFQVSPAFGSGGGANSASNNGLNYGGGGSGSNGSGGSGVGGAGANGLIAISWTPAATITTIPSNFDDAGNYLIADNNRPMMIGYH
jgi:hypothetical protein